MIAYTEADETTVPEYQILHQVINFYRKFYTLGTEYTQFLPYFFIVNFYNRVKLIQSTLRLIDIRFQVESDNLFPRNALLLDFLAFVKGEANPSVKLAVVCLPTETSEAKHVWLDLIGDDETFILQPNSTASTANKTDAEVVKEFYIARVGWWPDGSVMVQVLIIT